MSALVIKFLSEPHLFKFNSILKYKISPVNLYSPFNSINERLFTDFHEDPSNFNGFYLLFKIVVKLCFILLFLSFRFILLLAMDFLNPCYFLFLNLNN